MCVDEALTTKLQQLLTAVAAVTLHVHSKRFATGTSADVLRGYFDQLVELVTEANDAISKDVSKTDPAPAGGHAGVQSVPARDWFSEQSVRGPEHRVEPDSDANAGRGRRDAQFQPRHFVSRRKV